MKMEIICFRWAVEKGAVVIPGTGNPKHMRSNLDLQLFTRQR